jgi:hypothetical protein
LSDSTPPDRHAWPVRRYRLGEEPPDDLSTVTTVAERLAMMWPLTTQAWELAGLPLPHYGRADMPVSTRPAPADRPR